MEQAGWIYVGISKWGTDTRYPPKKTPFDLRLVMDYRPINSGTLISTNSMTRDIIERNKKEEDKKNMLCPRIGCDLILDRDLRLVHRE